ncbi:hypothetical protein KM043_000903 [Ampulex compressa]|nr:hypothetical protein KM043_000903 [Ampulex compressa]
MDSKKLKTIVLPHTSKTLDKKNSIKRKEKKVCKKGNDTRANAEYNSVELSSKSGEDLEGRRFSDDTSRNLGTPVVIEALSDTLSSMDIPEEEREGNTKKQIQTSSPTSKKEKTRQRQMEISDSNNKSSSGTSSHSPTKDFESTSVERRTDRPLEIGDPNSSFEDSGLIQCPKNIPQFYCLRNKVLVIMKENSRFCFTGKLIVKVVYGAVAVYGSIIDVSSGPTEIYSPRGYSSIVIETSDQYPGGQLTDVWTMLSAEGIDRDMGSKLQMDIDSVEPGTAISVLSNLENRLTAFLNAFYRFRLFPSIKNLWSHSWRDRRKAEVVLQSNLYFGDLDCKRLIVDSSMCRNVANDLLDRWKRDDRACALIAGGKNVGKSTTVRYLINSLLPTSKMVVLLDVDPGQAECTPAGCISYSLIEHPLMGPNFTHFKAPVYQLYIGDVNVVRCFTRYVESVKLLVDKLLSCPKMSRLPIIVNTMGFTDGIGWDIAILTIKLIRPSLVLQIMSERSKNNFRGALSKETVNKQYLPQLSWCKHIIDWKNRCEHQLLVIRSQAERKIKSAGEAWNMEPYQQRELAMISYLSDILRGVDDLAPRYNEFQLSINEVVPYVAPFSSLYVSLLHATAPPTHALKIVNGNIVALCGIDLADDISEESSGVAYPRVLTNSPLCTCYGFGIVRGIDMERKEVFINTPLAGSVMQNVNYLVDCMPVPLTLLDLNQRGAPYTSGTDGLPTSREPRRGYFRMRYGTRQSD